MISVVLIETLYPGNIGAVARLVKNFGADQLLLINPQCDHMSSDAMARAMHAKDVLEKAQIIDYYYLDNFDYIIGTTARIGTDYNIPRVPVTPKKMAEKINKVDADIAIIFGPEDNGLTNEDVLRCDYTVTIPASKDYPTLNLSHSVAILLYEISKYDFDEYPPMTAKEKQVMQELINEILEKMQFSTEDKRETQRRVWSRVLGKAMLTKREAFALLGFFRKLR